MFESKKNIEQNVEKQNLGLEQLSWIEKLLCDGIVGNYASIKDVELLKKYGLFKCLPIIKIDNPSPKEIYECLRLVDKYEFTAYFVDFVGKHILDPHFVYVNTDSVSINILFALNRLKLVAYDSFWNGATIIDKQKIRKSVEGGLMLRVDCSDLKCGKYVFEQQLNNNSFAYWISYEKSGSVVLENVLNGRKIIVCCEKIIKINYKKFENKLLFNFLINKKINYLSIFITDYIGEYEQIYEKENLNDFYRNINLVTTDKLINKSIKLFLTRADINRFYKLKLFDDIQKLEQVDDLGKFLLNNCDGRIASKELMQEILFRFFGLDFKYNHLRFYKPKVDCDFVCSFVWKEKKCMITRKNSNNDVCMFIFGGVQYKNFNVFNLNYLCEEENQIVLNY